MRLMGPPSNNKIMLKAAMKFEMIIELVSLKKKNAGTSREK
jgi:hypothetical protein